MYILHSIPLSAHTWFLPPTLGVFLQLVLAVEDITLLSTFTQVRYSDSGVDRNWRGVAEILQQTLQWRRCVPLQVHLISQTPSHSSAFSVLLYDTSYYMFTPDTSSDCLLFIFCCLFVFPTRCIVNEVRVIVPTPLWEVDSLNLEHTK